jgi:hypothetical protein
MQWDYAVIMVDHASSTGSFKPVVEWKGRYQYATITGYPAALFNGQVIQRALGKLSFDATPNIVADKHNRAYLTQGTSGGAWIVNFNKIESAVSVLPPL